MQICSWAIKRNDYVQQGEGRRSHLLPSKLLWVTNRLLGNGWLLMGMRDCPFLSSILEQTMIKQAWKINIQSLTCSLLVAASWSHEADLTDEYSSSLCSETVEFWWKTAARSLANLLRSICYIVLKVHWIYVWSIMLYLSFIDCLLSPVYEAACMSKTIFPMR